MTILDQIRARTDAATEGPWEVDRNYPFSSDLVGIFATSRKDYVIKADDQDEYLTQAADSEFIAHARQDVPLLLAAVDAVLALHKPFTVHPSGIGTKYCVTCNGSDGALDYPCPTVTTITQALKGAS